ncbi:MAG: hypothetical protein H7246_00440 [Phycisphaerae bacterium]|nr:hypothetical protein [Saprospiraceae bacterium]
MTNSYLLDVIKALRPDERAELSLFLQSPHFNKGIWKEEIQSLYQVILEAAPSFSAIELNKDRVYALIFQDKEMVRGKLDKLMTELNKLLKQYALWGRYISEKNERESQIDWASWLRERGLGDRFQQAMPKIKKRGSEDAQESLETYRIALRIAEEEHEWESENNQVKNDLNLSSLVHSLDAYYFNYRTELLNRFLLQQKAAQLPIMDWMVASIEEHLNTSLLLRIAQRVHTFLQKEVPIVDEFVDLLSLLRKNERMLSFQMNSQLYAYLRSSCSALINDGHLDLIPTLHLIHKENLIAGYLYVDNKIPLNAYLNLVQIANRAGDINWAKEFTENYKYRILGGDEDHLIYQLNMATCLFAAGQLEEALDQIPMIPSSSHYHMLARLLELKILYEMRSDLLHFKIFAFRKYIERTAPKSLSVKLREMNMHFLNLLLQISQSPLKDKKRSDRLVARIQEKKAISERAWLIEKARELA